MSTLKSSAEDLTLNADGSGNDVIIQSNASTVVTVDGSNSRVGIVKDSSGASTDASAVCHLENSGSALLQITSGTSATAGVAFGDSGNSNQASVYYDNTVNAMIFRTDNAERVRILAGGGITFNGDTAAANALDDYEEGTWTPTEGAGLTVVGDFSSSGSYTKIGRKVFVEGYVAGVTSVAVPSANAITISSLPFSINFSRAQGIAGNGGITASAGIQAPNTNIYFNEAVSATTFIRFAINYTTTA